MEEHDQNTTLENDTTIYEEPRQSLQIPPTGRVTRQHGGSRQASAPSYTHDEDNSWQEGDTIRSERNGRTSTPENVQQVPATLDLPFYEVPEGDLVPANAESEKEKEDAVTGDNAARHYLKRRNKYCNTCDSLRVTKDNEEIPHKLCEELADQNAGPKKITFMGREITFSDIQSFDVFVLNIETKDNLKNFYLCYILKVL